MIKAYFINEIEYRTYFSNLNFHHDNKKKKNSTDNKINAFSHSLVNNNTNRSTYTYVSVNLPQK